VGKQTKKKEGFSRTGGSELGLVAHMYNPSTWEAEVGGLEVQTQPGLHSETLFKKKKKRIQVPVPSLFVIQTKAFWSYGFFPL
jgi:hypothetical protein